MQPIKRDAVIVDGNDAGMWENLHSSFFDHFGKNFLGLSNVNFIFHLVFALAARFVTVKR